MLGIICGLESEAVLARNIPNAMVVCAAAQPEKARRLVQELINKGATRLLSFGIAGALNPNLPVGSLVIGTHVASLKGHWTCDEVWAKYLVQTLPTSFHGGVWGSEFLVPTAKDKQELHQKSQCHIVDMESQCMAEIAAAANKPIAVIRAVCDSADMDVPPLVMEAIAEDGSVNIKKALFSILKHPSQIPGLIHVGQGTAKALKTLEENVALLVSTSFDD